MNIFYRGAHRKTVLRQADAAAPQIRLDALVLHAVEAVALQQIVQQLLLPRLFRRRLRQQAIEEVVDHPCQLRSAAARGAEAIELGAPRSEEHTSELQSPVH